MLPALIVSPGDMSRVRRELTALDEYLQVQRLREPGAPMDRLPKLSRMLDDLAEANKLNLLHESTRRELEQFLNELAAKAPVLHFSFATEPSSASLQKLVLWVRQNINQQALIRVGLQPSIAAGCTLQTTNKYFDFSLRHFLTERRSYLIDAIRGSSVSETNPSGTNQ
jgi:hypothetical protein